MSAQQIIIDHDLWRKGAGGAPAGLIGQADSLAYAGLDLDLAQFARSSFSGTRFSDTSFKEAGWTGCTFVGCTFTRCDFQSISIHGCSFSNCSFSASSFDHTRFVDTRFTECRWDDLRFNRSHWENVQVLDCTGSRIRGDMVNGERVDFTGSCFEQLELSNARINSQ